MTGWEMWRCGDGWGWADDLNDIGEGNMWDTGVGCFLEIRVEKTTVWTFPKALWNNGNIYPYQLDRWEGGQLQAVYPFSHKSWTWKSTSILARQFHVGNTPMASTAAMIFFGEMGIRGSWVLRRIFLGDDLARHETLHSCYAVVGRFDGRSLQSGRTLLAVKTQGWSEGRLSNLEACKTNKKGNNNNNNKAWRFGGSCSSAKSHYLESYLCYLFFFKMLRSSHSFKAVWSHCLSKSTWFWFISGAFINSDYQSSRPPPLDFKWEEALGVTGDQRMLICHDMSIQIYPTYLDTHVMYIIYYVYIYVLSMFIVFI